MEECFLNVGEGPIDWDSVEISLESITFAFLHRRDGLGKNLPKRDKHLGYSLRHFYSSDKSDFIFLKENVHLDSPPIVMHKPALGH
jgi:hypothetical protein